MSNTAAWTQVEGKDEWTKGEGIYQWMVMIKDGAPQRWILLDHRSQRQGEYPGPYTDPIEQILRWANETITELCSKAFPLQAFLLSESKPTEPE